MVAFPLRRLFAFLAFAFFALPALANPSLIVDAQSGQVISATDATEPWFPASTTKLMTTYVALTAVREGRLTLDTPLIVSARAASMPQSKMGFRPGSQVTLDNALKMLMVHSPNDIAITVAEGVSGSVEGFAAEMNATAARLGLRESHFVNPNGLHNPDHYSSARDLAMIARALLTDFPEHNDLFSIGAFELNNRIYLNHNGLLRKYSGADGMKTGFTCAAGFNLVASATRGGRRIIVVALGYATVPTRDDAAAKLLDQGFSSWSGSMGSLASLPSVGGEAPNMRGQVCVARNRAAMAEAEAADTFPTNGVFGLFGGSPSQASLSSVEPAAVDPIALFVGPKPGWNGVALGPRRPEALMAVNQSQRNAQPAVAEAAAVLPPATAAEANATSEPSSAPSALVGSDRMIDATGLPDAIKGVKKPAKPQTTAHKKAKKLPQEAAAGAAPAPANPSQ
jgi:D-alanyl-D-alanine carboxypeptidase